MPDVPVPETVAVTIDGRAFDVPKGQLVIDAADEHGVYIPRFCYHPRMRSVGMCRMCIVDIDTGRGPALQPACMIPVADGMAVTSRSPGVLKAQDGVLEFLLVNHPLDCPVCDKGGECPLQDQAYAYGPGESRFVEEKRHIEKPIPISQLVLLDRERCILCDRCTRFADEVAGDPLIHFMKRGVHTEINTFPDHPFASYFSGNTVQICPVGALTAKPYRFRARPWDLDQVESTCTSCSVGCRVVIQSSRNRVLRYLGVDIDPVNWGWLCDKGRFDFEYVHHEDRLAEPLIRKEDDLVPATWSESLAAACDAIKAALDSPAGAAGIAFLGGSRLTNEAAYAWAKLAKGVIGTDNVDAQLSDGLPADLVLALPRASIDDICAAGATVLLLAPDLKEELPVLYLRLRDAVQHHGAKVIELSPVATGFTPYASVSLRYRPGEAAEIVRALVADGDGAPVEGSLAEAARVLEPGQPLLVVIGRPSVADSGADVVAAAGVLLDALPGSRFLPVLRRANVHGALDMGLAPGVLPGRVGLDEGRRWYESRWETLPTERGLDATGILTEAAEGRLDVLVLLGSDPVRDFPDRDLAQRAVAGAHTVVSVGTFLDDSGHQADVVLAAAGYAEVGGTTTNLEGRISTVSQKITPPGTARADWALAAEFAYRLGSDLGLESVDDIWDEIESVAPSHAGITRSLLGSDAGRDGVVAPLDPATLGPPVAVSVEGTVVPSGATDPATPPPNPRRIDGGSAEDPSRVRPSLLTHRPEGGRIEVPPVDAYSLRLIATRSLYDRGALVQHAPSLAGLVRSAPLRLNPYDFDRLGIASGGRATVSSPRATTTLDVVSDPAVPRGSAALTVNGDGGDPMLFIDASTPVTDVRVEVGDAR